MMSFMFANSLNQPYWLVTQKEGLNVERDYL
jgi:hypothetical protein